MTDIVAVIPARLESTRFPGKILASATGKPLIQHVYERILQAGSISRIIIATDSPQIAEAAANFSSDTIMTASDHPNGTSRIAEACAGMNASCIVNVQGDEPEICPDHIDHVVQTLQQSPESMIATIATPFQDGEDARDPNIVKIIMNRHGEAVGFSRAAKPPALRDVGSHPPSPAMKHVGLYAYRPTFLALYRDLEPGPHELRESLEQLRAIEHGYTIAVAVEESSAPGIDTPEQYAAFVERHRASTNPG